MSWRCKICLCISQKRYPPRTLSEPLRWHPGGCLNIKMLSYQYRDPHVRDKTVLRPSYLKTWESPYLGKTIFILRRPPGSALALVHGIAWHGTCHSSLTHQNVYCHFTIHAFKWKHSQIGKSSYISWSLEAARLGIKWSYCCAVLGVPK